MKIMEYYAVVVLYNKKIQESVSVVYLTKMETSNLHIIVIDNSMPEFVKYNQKKSLNLRLQYHSMEGNAGLSKAYNYTLDILKDKDPNDIVIWFDDDTFVNETYIEELQKASMDLSYDVFVPVIYGQNGIIYSPNEIGMLKGKYIRTPNQKIRGNLFNAINSCLAVRLNVYKDYSYDENLFMDCVDTKLFDDFRKMNLNFCVLPVTIYQTFFQRSADKDTQKYWSRFQIRINDTLYYSSIGGVKKKICGIIRVIGWGIVYSIKLKYPLFFLKCIKQMILSCYNIHGVSNENSKN